MSYTERLVTLFTTRPGEYFDGLSLAHIAGAYAWRSRVSDARRVVRRMGLGDIINRQQRRSDGSVASLYAYVPRPEEGHDAQ